MRPLDDDEVLDWWTAFDRGQSLTSIAAAWERPMELVYQRLDDLGVLFEAVDTSGPRHSGGGDFDRALIERIVSGHATAAERLMMEALGRLRGKPDRDDVPPHQPVPTCRVNLHLSSRRSHSPMSSHERWMNELATGFWRRIVARDLRKAGLLPRGR
jgi:hypothetical protein